MKIAVCISGKPREMNEDAWQRYRAYFIDQLPNADVFIYTSEDVPAFHALNPKKLVIEPQYPKTELENNLRHVYYAQEHLNFYCQQVYGMKRVWELKKDYERETGIKYDVAVRARADHYWLRPLPLEVFDLTKFNNFRAGPNYLMSCEFAIGCDQDVEKYMLIYDWLLNTKFNATDKILDITEAMGRQRQYDCHTFMTTYMLDHHKVAVNIPKEEPWFWIYSYYQLMWLYNYGGYKQYDLLPKL